MRRRSRTCTRAGSALRSRRTGRNECARCDGGGWGVGEAELRASHALSRPLTSKLRASATVLRRSAGASRGGGGACGGVAERVREEDGKRSQGGVLRRVFGVVRFAAASRTLCPSLSHFASLSVCVSPAQDKRTKVSSADTSRRCTASSLPSSPILHRWLVHRSGAPRCTCTTATCSAAAAGPYTK